MKIPKILLLVLFCLGWQFAGFAATIYVKPNASGAKNGTSWANAYTSLQSALSVAQNGDSLWIAAGTYKTASNGNTDAYFSVVKSLSIFGGFDGTETTLNQRDWKANATILSGDLAGNDTGPGSNQNDNSKRVIVVSNTSGVLIDGISITGGNCPTPGVGPDTGAGLDVFSSMTIRNCKFFWNYAISYGGALAVRGEGVQALIENCSFTNNVGDWNGGGAMFVESASATIKNSYFANNSGSRGGAVQLNGAQNIRFENSVFDSNYSRGGLGSDGGGAIWIFNGPGQKLEVIHCTFLNNSNSRASGGAIRLDSEYDSGSTLIANSIFAGSGQNAILNFQGTITNNLFDSAISGVTTSLDSPTFTNPNNPLGSDGVFGTRDDGLILAQNSNGIAKAVSAYSLESDATGSKRPVSPVADVGAYQTVVYVQGPIDSDTTAPAIAITSISANARLTSANATFGGTITEAGSKPTLQYRLGTTGNWTASRVGGSASPYSFSQLVALKAGPNTVQFQAKDDAGNTSALASVNVSYVVASTLTIPAPNAADGSVTSGFGGSTSREVGVRYTVTATPASGMVFKEWLKNGVSAGTNATLTFTMQPGLTLKPVFVPDFAKLGGFYNGLVGTGTIGSGSAADMQAFAVNNGFLQITSGANGALSGVLKIEGKSHSFTGTMGANKRATITVPRPGKGNATLSLSLVSALPGEISGNVTTSGAPLAFRALRAAYTAGAAKHALAGKRYAIVLPPPSGLAMGYGHATLTVEDNGAAVLSGVLANGQAVNAGARIVDDGAGNWVFPVYVGGSGIFTGEIVIPKTTPATGSELGGSLEWLKPASNTGLFKSGFLKSLQPLGATHSTSSAGLGGAAFSLTLDPAKRILPAAVVQTGTWGNSGSPILTTPVKNGLTLSFNPLSGKFEGSFTRTVNSAPIPTPIQGTLFSRPIPIPGGATLRGAGFFMSGNASTAVEITSNGTVEASANMVTVQGGTLPSSSQLAGQTVGTFQIGKYEVTWGEWKSVRDWAVNNNKGYDLAGVGETYPNGSADNFPVCYVSWYDVVKWSNARSEKEGKTPVYKNGNGTTYKTGEVAPTVSASANGYRLPTEKEWEWAARGGVSSQGYTYSGSNTASEVAWTNANSQDGAKAVGTKAANELGIYDMSGNVWEWCEEFFFTSNFLRGGSWSYNVDFGTVSALLLYDPGYLFLSSAYGFRLARSSGN